MDSFTADLILILHFAWAAWMILGVLLALGGFLWHRLWRWRYFRVTHLVAITGTATVPFWAGGICPLTEWEWLLRTAGNPGTVSSGEPFIIRWIRDVLFINVDPMILSLISGCGALITLAIFIWHPPRRD